MGENWDENRKFVLEELKSLNEGQAAILKEIGELRVAVAGLQVRSGVFASLAGVVGGALTAFGALWMKG